MKFVALISSDDGRLTKGRIYVGGFVWKNNTMSSPNPQPSNGLRIVVFDNRKKWMTFDPDVFIPMGGIV